MDYSGTLLLVSHDRTFLDNVVTSTIAFEGDGDVNEYIGGYKDWLRQKRQQKKEASPKETKVKDNQVTNKTTATTVKKKLSYNLQRELDQMPQKIDQLEQSIEALTGKLKTLQDELEQCFSRWEELEDS